MYIIHKMLVFLKNHQNYLKDSLFECFFKECNRILFFSFCNQFFLQHIMMESLRLGEEKIIKEVRNLVRLEKELNQTAIKDIRNLSRQEIETKAIRDRILRDIKNILSTNKNKIIINQ